MFRGSEYEKNSSITIKPDIVQKIDKNNTSQRPGEIHPESLKEQ